MRPMARLLMIAAVALLASCSKPAGTGGDDAKPGWDSERTADQLQRLRDRAHYNQSDR